MLLPICEECYKKIVATKARSILAPAPCQEPGMPIKEYHKLFQSYLVALGESIDTERKNRLFVYGLSDENREEVGNLAFLSARFKTEDFIENTVVYLSEMEYFKSVIFGKKDSKPADSMPMDV
jgi:hypothetical protein